MISVWILSWFFVTADGNNVISPQAYATEALCRAAGDEIYKYSMQLEEEKKITTYAGACTEVQIDTHAGSI